MAVSNIAKTQSIFTDNSVVHDEFFYSASIMPLDKILIGLLLLLMIGSLVSAFFYIYKDRGKGTRAVRALSWRIGIWIVLFGVIVIGIYTGWITPSNTVPMPPK